MSRNNDVFQVLVPTVAAPAAVGTTLDALAQGAIGAFSYNTNLALSPTNKPVEDFYLAMKVKNLAGQDDIIKSSGTHIQTKNIVNYNHKAYVAPVQMVTENVMKVITCGEEIGVKIEIRNQEAYRLNGFNQVVKSFLVPTGTCNDCDDNCFDSTCVSVLDALVKEINNDPDGIVVATKTDPTDCETADGKLTLTVNPQVLQDFCTINLGYFFPHQTQIIVTPLDGFNATTIKTEMVYEQGSGYDVKQLEYEAGGWNGKPGIYRVFNDGLTKGGFHYYSEVGKKYDLFHASYDQVSVSGWRQDAHFERTIIAAENGTIATAVKAFLDVIFS